MDVRINALGPQTILVDLSSVGPCIRAATSLTSFLADSGFTRLSRYQGASSTAMGFGGDAAHPAQKLGLLGRTTEANKATTTPSMTRPSKATPHEDANGGTNSTGPARPPTRKRLRPMELKQQQRLQKEQRKRAQHSSASSAQQQHPPGDTSTVTSASLAPTKGDRFESTNNGRSGVARRQPEEAARRQQQEEATSPAGGASLRDRRAIGGRIRGAREPLRRSASSPPNIGSGKG